MRSLYIIATLALASAAAVAAPAFAGGSDLAFSLPIGFSSGGEHKGLETLTNTAATPTKGVGADTTRLLPGGWDQGKADWKAHFHDSTTASPTSSTGHGHH